MLVKEIKVINKKAVNVISQVPKGWKSGRNHSLLSFIELARSSYRKDRHPNINSPPHYIAPPFQVYAWKTDNVKKMWDLIHLQVSSPRPPTFPWKEELVLLGPDSLWGHPAASKAAHLSAPTQFSLLRPVLNLREKASPLTQGEF